MTTDAKLLGRRLLAWFKAEGRALPWRTGQGRDPYRVWLSEIMLQQTTVATVAPYYERFLARWPTVGALAGARLDDVLHAWQGLGYYARARNLHRAARVVTDEGGGKFPRDEAGLARLPGVGPYTAAAIAAIAFGRPTVPVDGNVARVVARLYGMQARLPEGRAALAARARAILGLGRAGESPRAQKDAPLSGRAGDFAEALMDLGATVCTARNPRCGACPWRSACRAFALGRPEAFPRAKKKSARPVRHAVVFWGEDGRGRVLVRRRPEKGLLGGMMEFPSTPWREKPWKAAEALRHAPVRGTWRRVDGGTFAHVFSHFALQGEIVRARVGVADIEGFVWWPVAELDRLALPTVMKKAAAIGRKRPGNRTGRSASIGR
jgi:A/G-specific adenine glycosylase